MKEFNANALDLARLQLQQQRLTQLETKAAQAEAEDNRSALAVPFWGFRNGKAYGQLPDGGLIEVEASSNGAIQRGQIVMAVKGRGGRAIGRWMPR